MVSQDGCNVGRNTISGNAGIACDSSDITAGMDIQRGGHQVVCLFGVLMQAQHWRPYETRVWCKNLRGELMPQYFSSDRWTRIRWLIVCFLVDPIDVLCFSLPPAWSPLFSSYSPPLSARAATALLPRAASIQLFGQVWCMCGVLFVGVSVRAL